MKIQVMISSMQEITQVKEIEDDGGGRCFLKSMVLNVQIIIQIYNIYDIYHVHNISLDVSPLCSAQSIQLYVIDAVMSIILSRKIHVLDYNYVQIDGSSLSETQNFITIVITMASSPVISKFIQRRCHLWILSLSRLSILGVAGG